MIKLENIYKKFKQRQVLKNFSLEVKKGEFIAICGASGAGKTTILNLMGQLVKPDQGQVTMFGIKDPTDRQIQKIRQVHLGFVFQNYVLMENESVLENLKISKRYNPDWHIEKVNDVLLDLGLDDSYLTKKIYELSGGEQQRVAIARVLLKKCDLILADEPTGNLDEENKQLIIAIFKKLNAMGKTIVCVTHDNDMAQAADYIVRI